MAEVEMLLAALEADDADPATYLVLADALLANGDTRGELIQVQHTLASFYQNTGGARVRDGVDIKQVATRQRELLAERSAALFPATLARGVELGFKLGYLDSAKITHGAVDALAHVLRGILRSPDARLLRTLRLETETTADDRIGYALAKLDCRAPSALRRVFVGNWLAMRPGYHYLRRGGRRNPGELARQEHLGSLLDIFDRVPEVRIDLGNADVTWTPLRSQHLRRFTWVAPWIRSDEIAPLAESELPALEAFSVWTGGRYRDRNPRPAEAIGPIELHPILMMLDRCPNLRELGICNYAGDFVELADILRSCRFLERIEVLDLSHSSLEADDRDAVIGLLPRARSLRAVNLEKTELAAPLTSPRPIAFTGTPRQRTIDAPRFRVIDQT